MFYFLLFYVHNQIAISREDGEDTNHHQQHQYVHNSNSSSSKRIWKQSWHDRSGNSHGNKVPFNGYNSEEYLDRLEPNGNIPANKSDLGYGKRK